MGEKLIPLTEAHQNILEKRGITGEIAARLGWLTCDGRKGDWIAIPFKKGGQVVNHKFRTISGEKKFSQDKGGEQCFYNLEAIEAIAKLPPDEQRAQKIIITEGEMDCATALQCGYLAVSVPAGAPGKEIESEDSAKYDFLKDFPKFAVAVLAVDDDPAGHAMRHDLALRLGWHRCQWVQYPKGCKDLNEVFVKYGTKGISKVLDEKTKFMNEGGLFRMSEIPEAPEGTAFECGIGNVSDMIKLRPGDITVVTGIPSMGKTLFVNCMACNMARDHGWNVCFGSFEQSPRADHLRYLRTYYLDKPRYSGGGWSNWSDSELAEADAWIDKKFTFIMPDVNSDDLINLKWVLTRCRAAIIQHGARLLIIDPWNEIDHDRPQGMSLTEYTGFAIKEFRRLAKQFMVHVIIVAHPAKLEKNKNGGYGVPTLYDISDSSHWANKSDIGIIIHRIEGEVEGTYGVLVRVAKVRYWNVIGRTGDRILEYMPERGKYIDFPDFKPKRAKAADEKKTKATAKKDEPEDNQKSMPV